jgi:hypothetical protein
MVHAMSRQIGRGRDEASAVCAQSPAHQTRVARVGKAYDGVEPLVDYIDDSIAEIEIQYDLGVSPHKGDESIGPLGRVVHLWQYEDLADRERRRDAMEADPEWQAYRRVALEEDTLVDMENQILKPVPFFAPR